jgi:hypothetical protein
MKNVNKNIERCTYMFICIKLLPWYYCDVEETELPSEKMQRPG